jgi:(5-formylfuran-3-yl)methyl phosphate synthase
MTHLLISVKNEAEALIALTEGVDLIDLKDPNIGALGALDMTTSSLIVQAVKRAKSLDASRCAKLTTTIGENHETLTKLLACMQMRANLGVDYIKIAISEFIYTIDFNTKVNEFLKKNIKVIVVFYADESPNLSVLPLLKKIGIHGVMLDTQSKQTDLLALKNQAYLQEFIAICTKNDLICGFAGSLKPQHIDLLCKINATYIGFRGGVCDNNVRNADLNREKLRVLVKMLRENHKNTINVNKNVSLALHS